MDLTPRQIEVMQELKKGIKREEIAANLGLTDDCIKWHLNRIFKRLNVKGRLEAIKVFTKKDDRQLEFEA
jgi:DNA-binding NarL/FixJ family response regulator